ncbi:MAG: holo-ACP synthase [Thermodesulfobacteriota bacterium]
MLRARNKNTAKTSELPGQNISTGLDCESISRIQYLIQKKTFIKRVFTEEEASCSLKKKNPAKDFAGRFAAKEACMKALGTGLTEGLSWRDIEVIYNSDGSPGLILTGKAGAMVPEDKKIFLSLSYGAGLAAAFVLIV